MIRDTRVRLSVALTVVAVTAGVPSAAQAAVTGATLTSTASPATHYVKTFGGASMALGFTESYDGTYSPVLKQFVWHLDDDFAFDTTGLPQCPMSAIADKTTDQAKLACPGAEVGSGTATYTTSSTSLPTVLTAFNGDPYPVTGHPRINLLFDVNSGAVIFVVPGEIAPSSRAGDFGSQVAFGSVPNTPGIALTQLNLTFQNQEPAPGHHYISARCSDPDSTWNYAMDFTDQSNGTLSATAAQSCTGLADSQASGSDSLGGVAEATGQRSAALEKCVKIKSRVKRKKCRKRAKASPA